MVDNKVKLLILGGRYCVIFINVLIFIFMLFFNVRSLELCLIRNCVSYESFFF